MTHFLASKTNPDGYMLEALLRRLRQDLVERMGKIVEDNRQEAQAVFANDIAILDHLTRSIHLAEENTQLLEKAFGPHKSGQPRIGKI